MAALLGINPLDVVDADPETALIIDAIIKLGDKKLFDLQKRQAVLIGNEIGRVLKGMF